jgi:hypothetical protein
VFVAIGCVRVLLNRDAAPTGSPATVTTPAALLPVAVVIAACLYAPAASIGLLSDDFVLRRASISPSLAIDAGWFFRPLPLLAWRATAAVTTNPLALHTLNIVLHGVNGFLVAVLGARMGMARSVAVAAAVLFLVFPAAPEAVAWASGIQDVLMTTMALGAVVMASGGEHSVRAAAWSVALFVLALATKETAVCIPALMLLTPEHTLAGRRRMRLGGAVAIVLLVYVVLRIRLGIRQGFLTSPSRYFLKQLIANAYAGLLAPWRAAVSAAHPAAAFVVVATTTLLLTAAFVRWRRDRPPARRALRCAAWVLVAIAPVFSYFYVNASLEGSRYLYLAECGWALLIAELLWTVAGRLPRPHVGFALAIAIAAVASGVTLEHELTIWRRAAGVRDAVVQSAQRTIRESGCTAIAFDAVPDSVDGAYVFRNGFVEALDSPVPIGAATPQCTFTWTGTSFVGDGRTIR